MLLVSKILTALEELTNLISAVCDLRAILEFTNKKTSGASELVRISARTETHCVHTEAKLEGESHLERCKCISQAPAAMSL